MQNRRVFHFVRPIIRIRSAQIEQTGSFFLQQLFRGTPQDAPIRISIKLNEMPAEKSCPNMVFHHISSKTAMEICRLLLFLS